MRSTCSAAVVLVLACLASFPSVALGGSGDGDGTATYSPVLVPGTSYSCFADCLGSGGPSSPLTFRSLRYQLGSGADGSGAETETVTSCAALAQENGYTYFGVEDGGQCFADSAPPSQGTLDKSRCDQQCHSDSTQPCGGACAIQVYAFQLPTPTPAPVPLATLTMKVELTVPSTWSDDQVIARIVWALDMVATTDDIPARDDVLIDPAHVVRLPGTGTVSVSPSPDQLDQVTSQWHAQIGFTGAADGDQDPLRGASLELTNFLFSAARNADQLKEQLITLSYVSKTPATLKQVQINQGATIEMATTPTGASSTARLAVIIGSVVGGVALLLLIGAMVVVARRRAVAVKAVQQITEQQEEAQEAATPV